MVLTWNDLSSTTLSYEMQTGTMLQSLIRPDATPAAMRASMPSLGLRSLPMRLRPPSAKNSSEWPSDSRWVTYSLKRAA